MMMLLLPSLFTARRLVSLDDTVPCLLYKYRWTGDLRIKSYLPNAIRGKLQSCFSKHFQTNWLVVIRNSKLMVKIYQRSYQIIQYSVIALEIGGSRDSDATCLQQVDTNIGWRISTIMRTISVVRKQRHDLVAVRVFDVRIQSQFIV